MYSSDCSFVGGRVLTQWNGEISASVKVFFATWRDFKRSIVSARMGCVAPQIQRWVRRRFDRDQ